MSVRVEFVQEDRSILVSGGSVSVRELLSEVDAGDAVVIVKESIPGRCSVCGRRAFVRIPYAKLALCRKHFLEFVRKRVGKVINEYRAN